MRDPSLLWAPWVAHWFPGFTPDRMDVLRVSQYVDMHEFAERNAKG